MNTAARDRQELETAFNLDPADADAFAELRKLYQAEADSASLASLYERRSSHMHDGQRAADLLWQAAEIHSQLESGTDEIRVLNKALERHRGHGRSIERLKAIHADREDTPELLRLLVLEAEIIADSGGDPKRISHVEYETGRLWEEKFHRLDRAIYHYQRAFKSNPSHTDSIDAGRRIYSAVGDWQTVASLYQVEISTCADSRRKVELLVEMGRLQGERLDDLEAAARYLSEASQLRQGDEGLLEALGDIYASPQWPLPGGLDKAAAIFMQIAQRRHSNGDREGSISFLRRALGADPENEAAYNRLEQAYEETGRTEDLERLYRQRISVAAGAEATALQMRRGELLERKLGDLKGARECYESVLVHEPLGGPASTRLIEICRAEGDWEKVIELKSRALDGASDQQARIQLMMEIATITRDHLNEAETAAHLFHEVLGVDPQHRKALAAYEDYFRQMGDFRNLAELLRFAAETATNSGAPPMEICARLEELAEVSERRLGDLEGALDAWQQLAMIHPDVQRSNEAISRLGAKIKMWQGTIQVLERELEGAVTSGERLDTLRRMAQLYYEKKADPQRAIEILHQILEYVPEDEHTLHILLDLHERESAYDGVADTLERQLRGIMSKTERISALRRLAEIYQDKLSTPARALVALRSLLELLPDDTKVLNSLQTLLTRAEDYEQLAQVLEFRAQVSSELKDKTDALKTLARLMEEHLDNPGGAAAYWEEIRVLDPDDDEALDALSSIYDQTGRPAELLEVLKHRYRNSGQAPLATRARILRSLATFADQRMDNAEEAAAAYEQLAELLPADREALEALARFYSRLGRQEDLARVLGRQIELADDPEQCVVLAFKQADLLEGQLSDPDSAVLIFEKIISRYSPGDLDAHRRLKHLYLRRGENRRACEIAERELFLTPFGSDDHRSLALSIAKLWREKIKDDDQAALCYERVLELEPGRLDVLMVLRRIYHQIGAYARLIKLGPQLLAHLEDDQERCVLLLELAQVHEQQHQDPEAAFDCYRQAYDQHPSDRTALEQMERMAAQYHMWESLISAFLEARRQTRDPDKFRKLTEQVVNICQAELADPTRAFHILEQAIQPGQANDALLKELELLADAAGQINELLEIYEQLCQSVADDELRAHLLRQHARIAELKADDADRALDDHLTLFQLTPEDRMVVAEVERLAAVTNRWDDAIRIHGIRLANAEDDEARGEILSHVAGRLEAHVGDNVRAFRTRLRLFSLQPDDHENVDHLWRLAGLIQDSFAEGKNVESWSASNQTEEIDAIMVTEMDVLEEVLVIEPSRPPRGESTIDDPTLLELLPEDPPRTRVPPPSPASRPAAPPPPPGREGSGLLPARTTLSSPWQELALAHLSLPTSSPELRIRRLLDAAEVMARGAEDEEQAFDYLAEAASINIENARVQERLADLSAESGNFERLRQLYLDSLERTADASTLIWIHLKTADLMRTHGRQGEAEQHYIAVMAIQPDHPDASEHLRRLYQSAERWADLALLIERQLDLLHDRLKPSQRALLLEELADLYQHSLGRPFEAVDFLIRLLAERRDPQFMLRLADLYQELSIWPKLIEVLLQLLEQDITLELRLEQTLRVAQIYDRELELPDRAIEFYQGALESSPTDEAALLALERLFGAHDRAEDRIDILKLHVECAAQDHERSHGLLMRLAHALRELDRFDEAGEYLQRARALKPRDPETGAALARVLVHSGRCEDAVTLLQEQLLDALEHGRSDDLPVAILIRQASILDKLLDDSVGARKAFEHALTLQPENHELLHALGDFYLRREAWQDFVDIQLRLSACSSDQIYQAHALLNAAQIVSEKLGRQDRAIELYEQVLSLNPTQAEAIDALLQLSELSVSRREALLRLKLESLEDDEQRAETLTRLGHLLQDRGAAPEEIQTVLVEAFELDQHHTPAILMLAELHVAQGRLAPARILLQETLDRIGKRRDSAVLHFSLGEVLARLDRPEDAYRHFMDALRYEPDNPRYRIAAGLNRHEAQRWREALRHLQEVIDNPPAETREQAAHALFAAGQCEIELRHPERSIPYFTRALEQDPHHLPSIDALAQSALDAQCWSEAIEHLRLRLSLSDDPGDQIRLLRRLGQIASEQLDDPLAAAAHYERLLDLLGDDEATQLELLPRMLPVFRAAAQHRTAARTAEALALILSDEEEARGMLLIAAEEREQDGDAAAAEEHLREVLRTDPGCTLAIEGLSRALAARGDYRQVVELLTGLVSAPPPLPGDSEAPSRAQLFARLGEALVQTGDQDGAIAMLERSLALEDNPTLRAHLFPLYGDSPEHRQAARRNHQLLLAQDITCLDSLRALAQDALAEDPFRTFCYLQGLAALSTPSDEEAAQLAALTPPALPADAPYTAEITAEDRQERLMAAEVHTLREVFALLWEIAPTLFSRDLQDHGISAEDRVSPLADSDLARVFGACAKALGVKTTTMYSREQGGGAPVAVLGLVPPALLVSRPFAEEAGIPKLRFCVGRALELSQPAFILASGLNRAEFTRTISSVLKAFHPRYIRGRRNFSPEEMEDAARFRRSLPFKIARQLGELFRNHVKTQFDSGLWRQAVYMSANRAGLALCGDLQAALEVVIGEEPPLAGRPMEEIIAASPAVRDLLAFGVSDECYSLWKKLGFSSPT